jgi:predicted metalloenzyme YecM
MRVNDPAFEAAWKPYWKVVGEMFAKNQVSEGGPIILVQIENGE